MTPTYPTGAIDALTVERDEHAARLAVSCLRMGQMLGMMHNSENRRTIVNEQLKESAGNVSRETSPEVGPAAPHRLVCGVSETMGTSIGTTNGDGYQSTTDGR